MPAMLVCNLDYSSLFLTRCSLALLPHLLIIVICCNSMICQFYYWLSTSTFRLSLVYKFYYASIAFVKPLWDFMKFVHFLYKFLIYCQSLFNCNYCFVLLIKELRFILQLTFEYSLGLFFFLF